MVMCAFDAADKDRNVSMSGALPIGVNKLPLQDVGNYGDCAFRLNGRPGPQLPSWNVLIFKIQGFALLCPKNLGCGSEPAISKPCGPFITLPFSWKTSTCKVSLIVKTKLKHHGCPAKWKKAYVYNLPALGSRGRPERNCIWGSERNLGLPFAHRQA